MIGVSGRAMLEALIAGHRNSKVLPSWLNEGCEPIPAMTEELVGLFTSITRFWSRQSIGDMSLLRHGGMVRLLTGAYAPSTVRSFLTPSPRMRATIAPHRHLRVSPLPQTGARSASVTSGTSPADDTSVGTSSAPRAARTCGTVAFTGCPS